MIGDYHNRETGIATEEMQCESYKWWVEVYGTDAAEAVAELDLDAEDLQRVEKLLSTGGVIAVGDPYIRWTGSNEGVPYVSVSHPESDALLRDTGFYDYV